VPRTEHRPSILLRKTVTVLGFVREAKIFIQRKTNLVHSLFPVYFVKHLYMFRAYLWPIIRRYTVWIQQLVLIVFLDDCLLSWLKSGQQTIN